MTINGVSTCAEAGTEKYERFQSGIGRRRRTLVQYDYRHPIDRELFSCVKPTLDGKNIITCQKSKIDYRRFWSHLQLFRISTCKLSAFCSPTPK